MARPATKDSQPVNGTRADNELDVVIATLLIPEVCKSLGQPPYYPPIRTMLRGVAIILRRILKGVQNA